jgi:hypothetical protein
MSRKTRRAQESVQKKQTKTPKPAAAKVTLASSGEWVVKMPKGQVPAPNSYKVLHVGCGSKRKHQMPKLFHGDQWQEVRLDIDEGAQPDILSDIMDMKPVADFAVDAVFSSHNVEHVYIHQVDTVLAEFFRVLKYGGFAMVTLPDLQAVALHIAQGKLETALYQSPAGPITAIDILYGHTKSIANGKHYMAHKSGFTAETLAWHLRRVGFTQITVERDQDLNLWAKATKLPKGHPDYTDQMTVKGRYTKMVIDLPDADAPEGQRPDELDVPPKLWKGLNLSR